MAQMDALLKIEARTEGVNGIVALNRSLQGVERTAAGASVAMRGMAGSSALLTSSLGALTPLLSAAGLVGLVKNAIDAGDALNDMAQRTGVSVEALARFKKAAATSGTDIDAVAKSLGKLSRGMYEAATTGKGKAAEALHALGLSATDASGKLKNADQVTLEVADRFKAMPDGVVKTALAMQLFGKAGAEMIPMLNKGGAAIESLSVKMSTAFAQRADEYKDKLAALGGKVGALGANLTVALLPALNAITDAITGVVDGFNGLPPWLQQTTLAAAGLAVAWGPLTSAVKLGGLAIESAAAGLEFMRYQAALAGGVMPLLAGGLDSVKLAILGIPGWGWALAGVTALGALSAAVYANNKDFRDFVGNLRDVVAGDFRRSMETMGNYAASAGQFISDGWSRLVGFARRVGGSIAEAFAGPFGVIAQVASTAFGFVRDRIAELVSAIPKPIRDKLGMAVGNAAGGAVPGLGLATYGLDAIQRALAMGPRVAAAGGGAIPAPAREALSLDGVAGGGGAGRGKAGKARTVKEALGLTDAEMAAAVNTAIGEYNGIDPRGRTDVFANILARSRSGQYPGNLVDVVTQSGQYAPNFGVSRAQVIDPRRNGIKRFNEVYAELTNKSLLAQSIKDVDSRLYFKGVSEYGNMMSDDFLRARGQNYFHGPGRQIGRNPQITANLLRELDGADSVAQYIDEKKRKDEERAKSAEQDAKALSAARDLLTTKEAALRVAEAVGPLEKLNAEYSQNLAQIQGEYVEKLKGVRTAEEGRVLLAARVADLRSVELDYQTKLRDITDQQLIAERERAQALAESMSYMQELSSRSSVGAGLQQGLSGYVESVGNLRDAVGKLTTDSIGGLENSLTELATTGTTNFKAFAASVLADTSRMIIRQLILKTVMSVIGGIGGGTAKTFEMPGAAFIPAGGYRFAMGGVFTEPTLFRFANGGAIRNGLMGEAGPEAVMPLRRGPDGRLGVSAPAATHGPITINVDARGTKSEGDQGAAGALARDLARVVDDRLIHHRRPGGLLSPA